MHPAKPVVACVHTIRRRYRQFSISCILALLTIVPAFAKQTGPIDEKGIAALAERAMRVFSVPGMAIGIVHKGKSIYSGGHGIREIGNHASVNSDTLFKIGSNSKAFTTAALAILVDDGLVSWQGRVTDYIPEFRMSDPWVTAHFTLTDLLTHRSGLRSYVGDQMLWPEPNSFTRADIIHAFRYFELVSGFRDGYAYENLLYIVAGEVIPRVSGKPWGEFVDQRIMRPAGMKRCFASKIPENEMHNLAAPHGVIERQLIVIERGRISPQPPVNAAAGGIVCSLGDMLTWARTQLNRGTTPTGASLFSAAQSRELWKPRTRLTVSERDRQLNKTHFFFYGLGWRLADVHGYRQVSHTGSLAGFRSHVVLVPELELGVVLLSNGSSSAARTAVMNSIVHSFMPVDPLDWIHLLADKIEADEIKSRQQEEKLVAASLEPVEEDAGACCAPDLSLFTGRYRDPWFGGVSIRIKDGQLLFAADKSPKFSGALQHHDGDRFIVRWTDRTMNGDAWVMFERDEKGATVTMSMLALTDDGDWDYRDLHFTRVQ